MGNPEGTMGRPLVCRESLFQPSLAQAAIENYCRLGGLNNTHLFLTVLEASSSRSGCRHGEVLVRTLVQAAECQLLIVSIHGRQRVSSLGSLIRALIPFRRGLCS